MVRDFSDAAKAKLKETINQINDTQWSEKTDEIWDDLCGDVDISQYLDNLDAYHKQVLDRKDTTEADIDKIFADVQNVDFTYYGKSTSSYSLVQDQLGIIEALCEAINPDAGNFNANDIGRLISEHVSGDMQQKILDYYVDRLRSVAGYDEYGNPIYVYDYEYLHEIMKRDPGSLPPEVYLALMQVFNDMNNEERERFIEESYLNAGENKDGLVDYNTYIISPVFAALAELYQLLINNADISDSELAKQNSPIHEYIFNCALLMMIVMYAGTMYDYRGRPNVEIDEKWTENSDGVSGRNPWDYTITVKSWTNPEDVGFGGCGISFDIYQYVTNPSEKLERAAIDIIRNTMTGTGEYIAQEVLDLIIEKFIDLLDTIPGIVGIAFPFIQIAFGAEQNAEENARTQAAIDLLEDGDWCDALYMGASVTILPDGTVVYNYITVDAFRLNMALRAYLQASGWNVGYTAGDILSHLKAGTLDRSRLEQYVYWFNELGGKGQAGEYEKRLRKALDLYPINGKTRAEDLTYDEMCQLEPYFEMR